MRDRPGHGRMLSYYDFGRTTVYCAQADKRFSYCAYIPRSYDEDGSARYRLFVSVHGTMRDVGDYRDAFIAFAERHQVIILAPLFPAGMTAPGELSSYKMMRAGDLHYDAVLLSMIDELAARYRVDTDRFGLFGFSGGGHFAHRFLYLHPERLSAVSIGAPGIVTLLDADHDFWVGVRNFRDVFGKPVDIDAIRRVAVQMVVGGDDTDTWEIAVPPGSAMWMAGADLAGTNRQDRLRSLKASFENHGITVRHDTVPGVAHRRDGLMPAIEEFLDHAYAK